MEVCLPDAKKKEIIFGLFEKLRKATNGFVTSLCPSVCPHWATRFPQDGLSWNFIFFLLLIGKSIFQIPVSLKSITNNGCFTSRPIYVFDNISLISSRNEKVSEKKVAEKHTFCVQWSFLFFYKSFRLWDNVEKHCRARQATDDNVTRRMRIACWIIKATNTHSEYVIFIVFPLKMVARKCLNVTL